jgi:hypothetical protein
MSRAVNIVAEVAEWCPVCNDVEVITTREHLRQGSGAIEVRRTHTCRRGHRLVWHPAEVSDRHPRGGWWVPVAEVSP